MGRPPISELGRSLRETVAQVANATHLHIPDIHLPHPHLPHRDSQIKHISITQEQATTLPKIDPSVLPNLEAIPAGTTYVNERLVFINKVTVYKPTAERHFPPFAIWDSKK